MKKGLKKLVAGITISASLCFPILGNIQTASATTRSIEESLGHLGNVFDELSHLKDVYEFDEWFGSYWDENSYRFPNNTALEMYFLLLGIWDDMHNPPGSGVKPPLVRP